MSNDIRNPSSAEDSAAATGVPDQRKPYEPPRLIEYGSIAKLTETGGLTTRDQGNRRRRLP
jgi:hypothetical protein